MAQSLVIRNHCDVCLDAGTETPADTYRVDVRVMTPDAHTETATPARPADNPRPFVVELCPEHGADLAGAVLALVRHGRPAEKGKARTGPAPVSTLKTGDDFVCPKCGEVRHNVSSLRAHARKAHGASLAGVGFYPANFVCATCKDAFPNRQGMAAHNRTAHKQSA